MNDRNFENYQKRMLDAVQNPNKQSNDPFTKLSNILDMVFLVHHQLSQNLSNKQNIYYLIF